jgi:hypothetical protein
MERRLAAIFIADVVGYSRLMAVGEAGTLAVPNEIPRKVPAAPRNRISRAQRQFRSDVWPDTGALALAEQSGASSNARNFRNGSNSAVGSCAEHVGEGLGQTRLSGPVPSMSAKGSKADIWERAGEVAEVPHADIRHMNDAPEFRHLRLGRTYGKAPDEIASRRQGARPMPG